MKTLGTILILAVISLATCLPAYFTGSSQPFTTGQGNPAIRCQYRTAQGRMVWVTFPGFNCPQQIDTY